MPKGGKSIEEWERQFERLLKPLFATNEQTTLVLMNAIGFIFIPMTTDKEESKVIDPFTGKKIKKKISLRSYVGKTEFTVCSRVLKSTFKLAIYNVSILHLHTKKKIKGGECMPPEELMKYVKAYRDSRIEENHWGADMLFGMCKSFESVSMLF